MIIYGLNPVAEALKAGRVTRLLVGARSDQRLQQLLALAAERRVRVERVDADELERRSRGGVHQGVLAEVAAAKEYSVEDLVRGASGPPLVVVLDGMRTRTTSARSCAASTRRAPTASCGRRGEPPRSTRWPRRRRLARCRTCRWPMW